MVILVEVLKEVFKNFFDVRVDPRPVLKFDYDVESIDHGQMLKTVGVFLDILNKIRARCYYLHRKEGR